MIQKDIELITIEDLQNLKNNSVSESKILEYKKELNINSEKDKKEFLADFSSFANTSGGDLIYGISEKSGLPDFLDGIKVENIDALKLQIENILRDCIEPRANGYTLREIEKESGIYFLIIRIPKSWNSPHRVNYKESKRIYGRNTSGKYELDIVELRRLFVLSDSISIRLREFRENRIFKILSDETPLKLVGERKVVLHIVPLISLNQPQQYDIKVLNRKKDFAQPLHSSGWEVSYNFDGIISNDYYQDGGVTSYTQFFNNGIVEAVTTNLEHNTDKGYVFIPNSIFERDMFQALRKYLEFYKEVRIDFPAYLFITFINYKGAYLGIGDSYMNYHRPKAIDREILSIPEVYIESSQYNFHNILKPIFDVLWNSCGYERCLSYGTDGSYNPK